MCSRSGIVVVVFLLIGSPTLAQTQATSTTDLQQEINQLNETQKAILKELQAIHALLQQQRQPAADTLPAAPIDIRQAESLGSRDAKIAIVEFSDFQCPYCGRFEKDTYPQLLKQYVDAGTVRYVWRDLPLSIHARAQKAAEAARCAGEQGKFWEMHDRLFANQQKLADADLKEHAKALQLDVTRFDLCLDSGRTAAAIAKDVADARSAGISGTPSFLIGTLLPNGSVQVTRKLVGMKPFGEFESAIGALSPAKHGEAK